MAALVPPGAPRPSNGNNNPSQPPPHNYNPNSNPSSLADNLNGLNLNRPPSMLNSAPRASPFGQPPHFPSSAPPPGVPVASPPFARPGPPPGALARPIVPPTGPPQSTLPPNVAPPARPTGPPIGQPSPFGSRTLPGSFPSSVGTNVPPRPGAFQSSGLPSRPVVSAPPPGTRPITGSPTLTTGQTFPHSSAPSGYVSNGPPAFMSGTLQGGPRFPPAGNAPQPPIGPPPTLGLAGAAPQTASMRSLLASSTVVAPPGPTVQPTSPFSAPPQGVPQPPGPYGSPAWPMQTGQVGPSQPTGSVQPPRMFGMPPPSLPNQSMTAIPALGQTGAPVSGTSKIDPNQIPRPIPSSSAILFETRHGNQANPPPPATSDYIVRDTGNCSPRYMRCTISQIPCTADLLTTSGMQLALLIQPLALSHPSEEPVQIVDFGDIGPVRCSRCKAYINPFMKFIDQGRRFICNICGYTDETPRDYHCNLGPDGRRRDADERPELCRGTVEFVATKEYMVRDPMPAVYFFLIDVSMNAIQTGATAAACSAISQVISDLPEGPRTMVGIATFDSTIHFYNLKRALQQPLMLIVPDVQDVYTPLHTDVVVPLSESRQHLELLLESIPTMFHNNRTAESAFGAAVQATFLAIKNSGGKLLVFQSVLPSTGIGSLSAREAEGRTNISAGEKEFHKLLQPADKTLKTMAIEFAEYQVCVDVFITTQTYIDIASISVIPRTTGGQVYYYYPFSAVSDPAKLYNDLRWNITRPQGFEAVMRVRCSQGIQVQEYHGNFCRRIPTDVDLPGIDSDKTLMVTLKHDDKLQDGSECSFQCALLYTTVYGQRRIRVTTLSLPCTNMLSNLFRSADLDTQFACFLKQAASKIPSTPLLQVREQVTNLCINVLLSYRKFCATVTSSGQLILPEALKLLPLYTIALMKSTGLRNDVRIDDRSIWINCVSYLSTPLAIPLVYPRMVAIHDLNSKDEDESLVPPVIPLSSEYINEQGIYLLENGVDCLIYVGNSVDSNILQQLFGISSAEEISTQFVLQQYDNPLSRKVNDLVNEIRRQRCSYLRLKLCRKGDPSGASFLSHMVEDKNPIGPSYVEFLVHVHREIQIKMTS
ncbi:protein transport protein Sec24-like At4g32640 [Juglans regia]|uniref:Protein transport protein Sec24-like At4g32640 n=1 Tax=Juglans regia TaxID=51240 RepID=A0A2I4G5Y5_JUGRE|nr:protein transport protein Sec24-like At4g32640 [Juglans regia]